jgi:hypothetical protein
MRIVKTKTFSPIVITLENVQDIRDLEMLVASFAVYCPCAEGNQELINVALSYERQLNKILVDCGE